LFLSVTFGLQKKELQDRLSHMLVAFLGGL